MCPSFLTGVAIGNHILKSLFLYGRKSTHTDLEHHEGEWIMTEPLKSRVSSSSQRLVKIHITSYFKYIITEFLFDMASWLLRLGQYVLWKVP